MKLKINQEHGKYCSYLKKSELDAEKDSEKKTQYQMNRSSSVGFADAFSVSPIPRRNPRELKMTQMSEDLGRPQVDQFIKMTNRLQNIIKGLRQGSHLELGNEHFSNEIVLNESLQSSILGDITFFKVDFRNVNFIGSHLVACNFKNCKFNNVLLIKCEF